VDSTNRLRIFAGDGSAGLGAALPVAAGAHGVIFRSARRSGESAEQGTILHDHGGGGGRVVPWRICSSAADWENAGEHDQFAEQKNTGWQMSDAKKRCGI
jgi:hypothetical protein